MLWHVHVSHEPHVHYARAKWWDPNKVKDSLLIKAKRVPLCHMIGICVSVLPQCIIAKFLPTLRRRPCLSAEPQRVNSPSLHHEQNMLINDLISAMVPRQTSEETFRDGRPGGTCGFPPCLALSDEGRSIKASESGCFSRSPCRFEGTAFLLKIHHAPLQQGTGARGRWYARANPSLQTHAWPELSLDHRGPPSDSGQYADLLLGFFPNMQRSAAWFSAICFRPHDLLRRGRCVRTYRQQPARETKQCIYYPQYVSTKHIKRVWAG